MPTRGWTTIVLSAVAKRARAHGDIDGIDTGGSVPARIRAALIVIDAARILDTGSRAGERTCLDDIRASSAGLALQRGLFAHVCGTGLATVALCTDARVRIDGLYGARIDGPHKGGTLPILERIALVAVNIVVVADAVHLTGAQVSCGSVQRVRIDGLHISGTLPTLERVALVDVSVAVVAAAVQLAGAPVSCGVVRAGGLHAGGTLPTLERVALVDVDLAPVAVAA